MGTTRGVFKWKEMGWNSEGYPEKIIYIATVSIVAFLQWFAMLCTDEYTPGPVRNTYFSFPLQKNKINFLLRALMNAIQVYSMTLITLTKKRKVLGSSFLCQTLSNNIWEFRNLMSFVIEVLYLFFTVGSLEIHTSEYETNLLPF